MSQLNASPKKLALKIKDPMTIGRFFTENAVVIIFLGHALPWYTSVHFYWWYALVGSFALHVGAMTWSATSPAADRT